MSSPQKTPASNSHATFVFPSLGHEQSANTDGNQITEESSSERGSPAYIPRRDDIWQSRRTNPNTSLPTGGHGLGVRRTRQKSLSEALMTINNRRASISDNAHEIAEALKAPISWRLILYPSIQTMVPTLKYPIRKPNRELIVATLPMTAFQIGGHILNSDAMARIPVSLVHTIKGLSPLFTVLAYRFFFSIHYSIPTYLSLVPLTLGVVMACSANPSGNFIGLTFAFGSALLFVTQNIVSKRLFNEAARAESEGVREHLASKKPDKLNLLCYSSGLAFLFTLPIWLWSEAPHLFRDVMHDGAVDLADRPDALDHGRLAVEFIFNGSFHFAQSLVAFILLSLVSPVTYSVASLIKRVFVIVFSILWFGNPMTQVQGAGILLTFVGLYLYDRTNDRADKKVRKGGAQVPLLPLIAEDKKFDLPNLKASTSPSHLFASPVDMKADTAFSGANGHKSDHRQSEQVVLKRSNSPRDPGWIPEVKHDAVFRPSQPNGLVA
ncbi:MAG: suppressor of loss of ypt1 [Chrysothrix sp. TS-e1954]|nr:MAG: suppressor of loss of ypt1 [Chrysothrix sp. TS-e1954]